MFRPISVRLDRETEARLRRLAARTGMTQSDVVREALAGYAPEEPDVQSPSAHDRLEDWIGCVRRAGSSGPASRRRTLVETFRAKARGRGRPR